MHTFLDFSYEGSIELCNGANASIRCALIGDGSVFCWGRCIEAQMGDNTPPCTDVDGKPSPTPVSGLGAGSGVVKISAGNLHSCGVMSNGSAVCWGGESLSAVLSHGSQCFVL